MTSKAVVTPESPELQPLVAWFTETFGERLVSVSILFRIGCPVRARVELYLDEEKCVELFELLDGTAWEKAGNDGA